MLGPIFHYTRDSQAPKTRISKKYSLNIQQVGHLKKKKHPAGYNNVLLVKTGLGGFGLPSIII